ncbi:MAG: hypothetical protein SOY97_05950 [Candidatus Metalachnospira sp.]|nr:hypothetical protein [Candidatus Metalachnospira sp.]
MIYKLVRKTIENGDYDKDSLIQKLDVYLLRNRITSEQYEELTGMMN